MRDYPSLAERLRTLPEPVKNHYFFGMLLNEHSLFKEQHYVDGKRWLLNRLTLGAQVVLTGLDFAVDGEGDEQGNTRWVVYLEPGVALDGLGQEIVVHGRLKEGQDPGGGEQWRDRWSVLSHVEVKIGEDENATPVTSRGPFLQALADASTAQGYSTDAESPLASLKKYLSNPTDARSKPDKALTWYLRLELAYRRTPTDHVPVRAGSCSDECKPSTIREEFRARFVPIEQPPPKPDGKSFASAGEEPVRGEPHWDGGPLHTIFPPEPAEKIYHRFQAQQEATLPAPVLPVRSTEPRWVPIGVLKMTANWKPDQAEPTLTFTREGRCYRQLFSQDALSRLLFALAARVDEAARVRILTPYGNPAQAGNGQRGEVYRELPDSLKVQVINSDNSPLQDPDSVQVQFTVLTGDGGSVAPATPVALNHDHVAEAKWTLGKAPGPHLVEARIVYNAGDRNITPPAFHPGSRVLFLATARPTAPVIAGLSVHHLFDHHCQHWGDKHHKPQLAVVFSRQMDPAVVQAPGNWLQVWRIVRSPDTVTGPDFQDDLTFQHCEAVGGDDGDDVCWRAWYALPKLVRDLCPPDHLRVLVMIRPDSDKDPLTSVESTTYPHKQVLSATFEGSYLSKAYRQALWEGTIPAATGHEWARFEPREGSLPSGDGEEGGEFHKTFEFHLPGH